jgi:hypothetical protein
LPYRVSTSTGTTANACVLYVPSRSNHDGADFPFAEGRLAPGESFNDGDDERERFA